MIGIVIPTLNRSHFLQRAMNWYNRSECKDLEIIVVDSSPDESVRQKNADIIGARGKHFETPDFYDAKTNTSSFGKALELGGKYAESIGCKYVLHAGDDDFILPKGIQACADAMEKSPGSVIGCVGNRVRFGMKGAWGQPVTVQEMEYPPLHQGRAQHRMLSWFNASFTLQFATVRIDAWRKSHMCMEDLPTWYFGNEIFPNIHMLLQGKVIKVPEVSVCFQVNPDRQFGFDTWAMYDLVVKDPTFSKTMETMRHRIKTEFTETALRMFDEYFKVFLAKAMVSHKGDSPIRYDGLTAVPPPVGLESVWETIAGEGVIA